MVPPPEGIRGSLLGLPAVSRPGTGSDTASIATAGQRKCNKRATTGRIGKWSSDHEWVGLCRAWDAYLQRERDKVAAAEARKWERRRQQALESNWGVAQQLRAKLEKMLAWPIQRQTTEKDGKSIVIEPARWSFQTVALIARTAAEIEAATLLAVGTDVDALSDAETRATAEEPGQGEAPEV